MFFFGVTAPSIDDCLFAFNSFYQFSRLRIREINNCDEDLDLDLELDRGNIR